MREISWFVFPFFLGGAALPDRYANSRSLCLSVCACLFIFSVSLNLVVRQRLVYSPGRRCWHGDIAPLVGRARNPGGGEGALIFLVMMHFFYLEFTAETVK